ncbi:MULTISPECIES: Hsp20/alpha crystallin family protein [unclassified Lentimonas]|uniref:Hsp20/alpha crystallin family protein n=1 Tax=unclassified Lentimonas TaxID=2630993 RepID=UPI001325B833|nr:MULTISPECIES: Hsp20/alpha crystallin family protein [unclassified Lentimonas]CAA6679465.1 Unannotated [Lentimonas sp. CC4]CAA6687136.1 Unannotated [Lentimonas sp. CC6]CAA7075517.1 Unannotated [Lentimonas sp. CC4]CAA7170284.1 Unannotated [Lentimonas sp. CC21]CAA7182578.1 Unannotated [Lentimonas sp. CC8]
MNTTELEKETKAAPRSTVEQATEWRRPHFDVSESADAFEVKVSLPGVSRESVDISLEGESLSIIGKRSDVKVPSEWRPVRRELPQGDYRLNFQLNVSIDEEAIQAQVADGVLQLTLPKADLAKPRKIVVS